MLVDHINLLTPVEPDELQMLQRVFDQACATKAVQKRSRRAEELAATIITYYQHGIREERQLYLMVI